MSVPLLDYIEVKTSDNKIVLQIEKDWTTMYYEKSVHITNIINNDTVPHDITIRIYVYPYNDRSKQRVEYINTTIRGVPPGTNQYGLYALRSWKDLHPTGSLFSVMEWDIEVEVDGVPQYVYYTMDWILDPMTDSYVSIYSDKTTYVVGETATITVLASYDDNGVNRPHPSGVVQLIIKKPDGSQDSIEVSKAEESGTNSVYRAYITLDKPGTWVITAWMPMVSSVPPPTEIA